MAHVLGKAQLANGLGKAPSQAWKSLPTQAKGAWKSHQPGLEKPPHSGQMGLEKPREETMPQWDCIANVFVEIVFCWKTNLYIGYIYVFFGQCNAVPPMQHRHQALERLIYIYSYAQLASQVVGAFSMEQQAWKSLFFVQCTVSLFQGFVFEMWSW